MLAKLFAQINPKTLFPFFSDSDEQRKTPSSVCVMHQHVKVVKKAHGFLTAEINLLTQAVEKMSVSKEILKHKNAGLRRALINEQKRRKKGKKMEILNKKSRAKRSSIK